MDKAHIQGATVGKHFNYFKVDLNLDNVLDNQDFYGTSHHHHHFALTAQGSK